jgi:hypothetical protein
VSILLSQQKKDFHRFEANIKWFQDNYKMLKKEYAGEYVAIDEKKVLMHDKDARTLIKALREQYKDIGPIVIEFVTKEKMELIL